MSTDYIDATPNPEFLIKSIAEQGYTLESALADLIDNSISAGANLIEILYDIKDGNISLYVVDNGNGMSKDELKKNMQFPSSSLEIDRGINDLGRFGLGMKTASFSQTRKFTTLSREKGLMIYNAATWDVNHLKTKKKWEIIINSSDEIDKIIFSYSELSKNCICEFSDFVPNTIIKWEGLYKFENYIETKNLEIAFSNEMESTVTEHLGLVFHRFIEKDISHLKIKINNTIIDSFNPFPENGFGLRSLELRVKPFGKDNLKIQGFVLPISAKNPENSKIWTTEKKGLADLEGLYIYRSDRVIFYGGWNGLIKKHPHLQLSRLKIDVGNLNDNKLQLNVSKSNIIFPFEHRLSLLRCLSELNDESKKEYANNGLKFKPFKDKKENFELLNRIYSTKGLKVEINEKYPLLKILLDELDLSQKSKLNMLFKSISTEINKIKHVHEEQQLIGIEEKDGVNIEEIIEIIEKLKENGMNKQSICDSFLKGMGFNTHKLPEEIENLFLN